MTNKPRKAPITNESVIEKLIEAGLYTATNMDRSGPFHRLWRKAGNSWWEKKRRPFDVYSYMIPANIYNEYCAKFMVRIPLGSMVRLSKYSSRSNVRTKSNNDTCDTKDWYHLGFGSGKEYYTDIVKDYMQKELGYGLNASQWQVNHAHQQLRYRINNQLLINNEKFPLNFLTAFNRAQALKKRGIKIKSHWSTRDFTTDDFLEKTEITADGILGQKKLINGWISQVYVHFLYPKWETKREARYEITFETGARGIFTSDYIERVYDTDYSWNDNLYCCNGNGMGCQTCYESEGHEHNNLCDTYCVVGKTRCELIFDYSDLFDLTHGKALDYVQDDDNV